MPRFELDNISLEIAERHLSPEIRKKLARGRFEHQEVAALGIHLQPDDRLLEIGAGIGYTIIVAAQIIGGENIVAVEANPALFANIQENFALNGVRDVSLIHCAAMPNSTKSEVELSIPKAFYAASIYGDKMPFAKRITVPVRSLADLLTESRATVLLCDAEGVEMQFFQDPFPKALRLIILEVHPDRFEEAEIEAVFERLAARGFRYCIDGSDWPVACFQRK